MESSNKVVITGKIVGWEVLKDEVEVIIPTDLKLPDESPSRTKVLRAEGRKWYLTVVTYEDSNKPFALFCRTNNREKSAQTSDAVTRLLNLATTKGIHQKHIDEVRGKTEHDNNVDKLTRTISLLLRHGVLVKNIVTELNKMEDVFVGSFLFQIRKFLSQYIKDGEKVDGDSCPECGGTLVYAEGCMLCRDCGHSKCG